MKVILRSAKIMCKRKRITGFTLVELLVVIAIIALLMSILMPALRRVKMQAQEVACRNNTRQIGLIIYMYLEENDFYMPHLYEYDYGTINGVDYGHNNTMCNGYLWSDPSYYVAAPMDSPDDTMVTWPILVPEENRNVKTYWGCAFKEFVKDTKVFGCPAFKNALEMMDVDKLYGCDVGAFYDSAFAINGYLDWININSIKNHGEVIVASDHVEPRIEQADDSGNTNDMFCPGTAGEPLTHYTKGSRTSWYRGIFRHNIRLNDAFRTGGRVNVLWLDNHVNMIEERDVFDLKIPDRAYDPLWKQLTPP